MRAALYFDDIEGFGEWPILLSTRAQKYLRDVGRDNNTMFGIVMKKIEWVSTLHSIVMTAADFSQATVPGALFS